MRRARRRIVAAARAWLGTPYRHQAATRGAGCDCLGLLRGVWRELYGSEPLALPAYRADWRDLRPCRDAAGDGRPAAAAGGGPLAAGQVVLFRLNRLPLPKHCAILVAPDRFIHAQERLGVVEAGIDDGWRRRLAGAYEFPPIEGC